MINIIQDHYSNQHGCIQQIKSLLTGEGVHEERRALAKLEVLLGGRRLHDGPVGLQDEEVIGLEALLLHGRGRHVDAVPGIR